MKILKRLLIIVVPIIALLCTTIAACGKSPKVDEVFQDLV